jgi:hypothetical protein
MEDRDHKKMTHNQGQISTLQKKVANFDQDYADRVREERRNYLRNKYGDPDYKVRVEDLVQQSEDQSSQLPYYNPVQINRLQKQAKANFPKNYYKGSDYGIKGEDIQQSEDQGSEKPPYNRGQIKRLQKQARANFPKNYYRESDYVIKDEDVQQSEDQGPNLDERLKPDSEKEQ